MTIIHILILWLVAFRLTRLVGWDEITLPIRTWVCGLTDDEYFSVAKFVDDVLERGHDPWNLDPRATPQLPIGKRRFYVAKLLHCPWCVGFWISAVLAVVAWQWWLDVSWLTAAALAFALSSAVGLTAKNLDP